MNFDTLQKLARDAYNCCLTQGVPFYVATAHSSPQSALELLQQSLTAVYDPLEDDGMKRTRWIIGDPQNKSAAWVSNAKATSRNFPGPPALLNNVKLSRDDYSRYHREFFKFFRPIPKLDTLFDYPRILWMGWKSEELGSLVMENFGGCLPVVAKASDLNYINCIFARKKNLLTIHHLLCQFCRTVEITRAPLVVIQYSTATEWLPYLRLKNSQECRAHSTHQFVFSSLTCEEASRVGDLND